METRARKHKKVSTFPFEDLPVEIDLEVMSYLDTSDLIRCTRVSKRIRALCQDQSLWQKINLSWKKIPSCFVQFVLDKDCKSLILHGSTVMGRSLKLTEKMSEDEEKRILRMIDLEGSSDEDGESDEDEENSAGQGQNQEAKQPGSDNDSFCSDNDILNRSL